jgi:hypothetical protein
MKKNLYRAYNKVLIGILTVLGVNCGPKPDEYGTPYATYASKGNLMTNSLNK